MCYDELSDVIDDRSVIRQDRQGSREARRRADD